MDDGGKLNRYLERIEACQPIRYRGRVRRVVGLVIESEGPPASIGDLCSIERRALEQGIALPEGPGGVDLERLVEPEEYELMKFIADYPALVGDAAADLAPHRIIYYLKDLAGLLHSYYFKHKVIGDDEGLTGARLLFCRAVRTVFRNGLNLIGLSAPESM